MVSSTCEFYSNISESYWVDDEKDGYLVKNVYNNINTSDDGTVDNNWTEHFKEPHNINRF